MFQKRERIDSPSADTMTTAPRRILPKLLMMLYDIVFTFDYDV